MKRNIYLFFLFIFSSAALLSTVSCTKEESILNEKELRISQSLVFVETGKSTTVNIEGADDKGTYALSNPTPDIFKARVNGSKLMVDGLKEGSGVLTITDKYGLYLSIDVEVGDVGTSQTDSLALLDLYKNTNPEGWVQRWQINFPMKYWHGVTVNQDNRVVALDLKANGLVGILPNSISKLFFLKKLDLSYCKFNNELPDLSRLVNLTSLKLNFMKGLRVNPEVLENLTRIKKIETLGIIDVFLTAPLKPIFDRFQNLKSLELGFLNHPDFPLEICNIKGLQSLEIYDGDFGNLPPEIGRLKNLRNLVLAEDNITGEIPEEIGDLYNLGSLNLAENKLSGKVPASINKLKKLHSLLLFNNQLTALPEDMSGMESLNYIGASNNAIGNLPKFGDLKNLQTIHLQHNEIVSQLVPEWSNIPTLKDIELSYNRITGPIPDSYGSLKSLRILLLQNNNITGTVPESFANFKRTFDQDFYTIDLRNNRMSGDLSKRIRSNWQYVNDKWFFSPQQNGYGFKDITKIINEEDN